MFQLIKPVLIYIFITMFLAACGGGGYVVVDPPVPDKPNNTDEKPVDDSGLIQTFIDDQEMDAISVSGIIREQATKFYQSNGISTNSKVVLNWETKDTKLVISSVHSNDEETSYDVSFSEDNIVSENDRLVTMVDTLPDGRSVKAVFITPKENDLYLSHVTGGALFGYTDESQTTLDSVNYFITGRPYELKEMPTTGTANYDLYTYASVFRDQSILSAEGAGSLNVSFASGDITGDFPTLYLTDADGNDLGSEAGFSFTASITGAGESTFAGVTTRAAVGDAPELTGSLSGGFYGVSTIPNEVGAVYSLSSGSNYAANDINILGMFVGRKKNDQ